jgi:hypothetical protein
MVGRRQLTYILGPHGNFVCRLLVYIRFNVRLDRMWNSHFNLPRCARHRFAEGPAEPAHGTATHGPRKNVASSIKCCRRFVVNLHTHSDRMAKCLSTCIGLSDGVIAWPASQIQIELPNRSAGGVSPSTSNNGSEHEHLPLGRGVLLGTWKLSFQLIPMSGAELRQALSSSAAARYFASFRFAFLLPPSSALGQLKLDWRQINLPTVTWILDPVQSSHQQTARLDNEYALALPVAPCACSTSLPLPTGVQCNYTSLTSTSAGPTSCLLPTWIRPCLERLGYDAPYPLPRRPLLAESSK